MAADVALSATDVAEVLSFVAPGYLAQLGYRARYPAPERSSGQVLVVSVVLSLPLVAAVDAAISGSHKPTQLGYVFALTAGSFAIGYLLALVRGTWPVRAVLSWLGYRSQPEGSMWAQTLKHMTPSARVLIELKDGRRILGVPRRGPETQDDGINELYLVYPTAPTADGEQAYVGEGIIVPLSEVSSVVLEEDPTTRRSSGQAQVSRAAES
jgi:hypothetical protein